MQFKLTISMDNAAFQGSQREIEVERILEKVKENIMYGLTGDYLFVIHDINGNRVGTAEVVED